MRTNFICGIVGITALAGLVFLPLPRALAQKDEKDAVIELLKKQVELQQKQIELLEKQAKAQNDRLKEEIELLVQTIKKREAAILKLETRVKELRISEANFEARAKTAQIRNEALLEELVELVRERNRALPVVQAPNLKPNLPTLLLNGKIEKVEGDLVLVTLGTDHGLNKNHTLDVYRLKPEPKYLGTIRIVDANHHKSVGRLIPADKGVDRPALMEGDLVTSRLPKAVEPKKEAPKEPEKNPPAKKLNGLIEKLDDKDASLVSISIGSDVGLAKGHTLEVYRLKPQPKYLGTIRIIEISEQKAVGKRIGPNLTGLPALDVGDRVTSSLEAAEEKKGAK
jgi:hypothetical protein